MGSLFCLCGPQMHVPHTTRTRKTDFAGRRAIVRAKGSSSDRGGEWGVGKRVDTKVSRRRVKWFWAQPITAVRIARLGTTRLGLATTASNHQRICSSVVCTFFGIRHRALSYHSLCTHIFSHTSTTTPLWTLSKLRPVPRSRAPTAFRRHPRARRRQLSK